MKFLSVCTSLFLAAALLPAGAAGLPGTARTGASPLLSPGLSVLAAACELVVSTPPDGEAVFTAEDFRRTVGAEIATVTVAERPDPLDGQLVSGSVLVPEGQTLTAADLSRLSFVPASSAEAGGSATFRFAADGSPYLFTCRVLFSDAAATNSAPTVACASGAARTVNTYAGRVCSGSLAGSDPDGDALVCELTSYPAHGGVLLIPGENGSAGSFVYCPLGDWAGKDSFSYTVRDSLGRYAADSVTVSVRVARYSPIAGYADMDGAAECAAIRAEAAGLMNGKQVGDELFFEPDGTVSRAEYLAMLLKAAGIGSLPDADCTVFADGEDVPPALRGAVAAGYALGLADGWIVDGAQCFLPDEPVSVAEAAVMTARLLGLDEGSIPVSAPVPARAGAPSWARGAVAALTAAGIPLPASAAPSALLDRAGAAALFGAVRDSVGEK